MHLVQVRLCLLTQRRPGQRAPSVRPAQRIFGGPDRVSSLVQQSRRWGGRVSQSMGVVESLVALDEVY